MPYPYHVDALMRLKRGEIMSIIIQGHEVRLTECSMMPKCYWYTLFKGCTVCYKQRTALKLDDIISEVEAMIKLNTKG